MDTSALSDAFITLKVIVALQMLASFVSTLLAIAAFFRRQPSIDSTLTALIKEFNAQLQERVLIRDFSACDARHAQQVRDVEARFSSVIVQMEHRMDQRFAGFHDAILAIRKSQEQTLVMLQDLYKDGGWTRGKLEHAT